MKIIKKLLQLNFLLILLTMFLSQPAMARDPFEERVDSDADGICDDDFFLGPYDFCEPNENDEPDNCPETANPDQLDSDDDGIGDACDPDEVIDFTDEDDFVDDGCDPNDLDCPNPALDPIDGDTIDMPSAGGCSLFTQGKTHTAAPLAALFLGVMGLVMGRRFKGNFHK